MNGSMVSDTCMHEECAGRVVGVLPRQALEPQAEVLRALAHSVRLQILLSLRGVERCVCEFEPLLGLRQPNISQHLSILRGASLVATRREGMRIMYRLVDPDVRRVVDLVTDIVRRHGTELAAAVTEFPVGGEGT